MKIISLKYFIKYELKIYLIENKDIFFNRMENRY